MDNKFTILPEHVGIIMDGNGRWAKNRGKKRSDGHKQGVKILDSIVKEFFQAGVNALSLFAFSTENFNRPKEEVDNLMDLLKNGVKKFGGIALKNKVRLKISGDLSLLPPDLQAVCNKEVENTKQFISPVLNICIGYSGQSELCNAFNRMLQTGEKNVDKTTVENYLYTSDMPPLDLVIRTGGERRISNFMLWQAAYAELYFTDVLWPDFSKEDVYDALDWFAKRSRRFGKV